MKKQVSLALPEELIVKLDAIAADEQRSRSVVAERLITEALRVRESAVARPTREPQDGSSS